MLPADGLSPEQLFLVGFAQWACADKRPESLRLHAATDPHSPTKYRLNGVVVNMPEFGQAFSCKADAAMVKTAEKICRIWYTSVMKKGARRTSDIGDVKLKI